MSPTTLFANQEAFTETERTGEIIFQFKQDTIGDTSFLWQQVNDILRSSIERTDSKQETPQRSKISVKPHILVAPGMLIPGDEYKRRFGTVDLEEYRRKMTPELFLVFVRHVGSIPGISKLDIEKLVSNPED